MHEILNWSNLFYNKLSKHKTTRRYTLIPDRRVLSFVSWLNMMYIDIFSSFTCSVLRSPPGRWPSCPCSWPQTRVRPWHSRCPSHAPHVSDTRSWVGSGWAPSPPRTRFARASWQPAPGQCSWQLNIGVSTTRKNTKIGMALITSTLLLLEIQSDQSFIQDNWVSCLTDC